MTEEGGIRRELRFAIVPEWVIDADVSAVAVRLYCVLARYADGDRRAFPKRATLAERCRVSLPTLDRAKAELVAVGALREEARFSERGDRMANEYVLIDCPQPVDNPVDEVVDNLGTTHPPSSPVMTPPHHPRGHPLITSDEAGTRTIEREPLNENVPPRAVPGVDCVAAAPKKDRTSATYAKARGLCALLAELMVANGCKQPRITDAWVDDMERLLRIDGRTADQVERAIRWCQADPFWRANVLSPAKLRAKYDALRLAAQRDRERGPATGDIDTAWAEVQAMIRTVGGARGRPEGWSSELLAETVRRIGWRELCMGDERTVRRSFASNYAAVAADLTRRSA